MDRHGIEIVSGDDALSLLRDRLGLYERVPVIEEVHPAALALSAGDDEPDVLMCCHDSANERAHTLLTPAAAMPDTADGFMVAANRVLAGPWN